MFGLALTRRLIPKFVPKLYVHCKCEECLYLNRDYCEGWKKKRKELCCGTNWEFDCELFKPYEQGKAIGCPSCRRICEFEMGSGKQYINRKEVVCNICDGKGWIWKKIGAVV